MVCFCFYLATGPNGTLLLRTHCLGKWSSNRKYEQENNRENLYPDVTLVLHNTVNVKVLAPMLL